MNLTVIGQHRRTASHHASVPYYKRQAQYELNIKLSLDTSDGAVVGGPHALNRTTVGNITVDKFLILGLKLVPSPPHPSSSTCRPGLTYCHLNCWCIT
jgi:hypothetical protein